MKIFFFMTIIAFLYSCNHENSALQEVSNSIEENTRRANELSNPLFSKDSIKNDFKFKTSSELNQPTDSSVLHVIENIR